jgi:hypothetical protein
LADVLVALIVVISLGTEELLHTARWQDLQAKNVFSLYPSTSASDDLPLTRSYLEKEDELHQTTPRNPHQ